jgi:hypothetical protein
MSFSPEFLALLVYAALAAVVFGVVLLLALLLRDAKDRKLW